MHLSSQHPIAYRSRSSPNTLECTTVWFGLVGLDSLYSFQTLGNHFSYAFPALLFDAKAFRSSIRSLAEKGPEGWDVLRAQERVHNTLLPTPSSSTSSMGIRSLVPWHVVIDYTMYCGYVHATRNTIRSHKHPARYIRVLRLQNIRISFQAI
jgi:hypothetical protein